MDFKLNTPVIDKTKIAQQLSEAPLEQILAAYKKEENGEEEGDALVDKLVELIQQTPSLKL